MVEGHLQDFPTLASYLRKFKDDMFLEAMSDFHVLIYVATMDMLPLRVRVDLILFCLQTWGDSNVVTIVMVIEGNYCTVCLNNFMSGMPLLYTFFIHILLWCGISNYHYCK